MDKNRGDLADNPKGSNIVCDMVLFDKGFRAFT
jgi:hypothetical protein